MRRSQEKHLNVKEVYVHESLRAFNGDGYSIWVYELDEEVATIFLNPEKAFFTSYPIKADYREKWSTKHWESTPLKADEEKFLYWLLVNFHLKTRQTPKSFRTALSILKRH